MTNAQIDMNEYLLKIREGLPKMSEFQKGYFLGTIEALSAEKTEEGKTDEDSTMQGM
jgi:hypothetical protein